MINMFKVNLSRDTLVNLIYIFFLLMVFPLLWLYNQRLNYRSFLTLDTKFSISANALSSDELSSVNYIIRFFDSYGLSVALDVRVKDSETFGVLGRALTTPLGTVVVYEYSSPEDASKDLVKLRSEYFDKSKVSLYKNLLIHNESASEDIDILLKELGE